MDNLITKLAQTRQIHAWYKDKLAKLERKIAEMVEERYGKELERATSLLDTAKQDLDDAETAAREAALSAYAKSNDKKPHPAIQIKLYTILEYSQDAALDFCREKHRAALKLNKREFEKAAKVLKPEFVTVKQEPRATIARDLSPYLSQEQ